MQFIPKGPDVPNHLLQQHEEGEVVFFCGAGISYPAGLPGFSGLVTGLYSGLGVTPSAVQKAALDRKQFDTAIGLLEKQIVGERLAVRRKLAEILTADPNLPGGLDTHYALLTLARTRKEQTRLITTNFDRLFLETRVRFALDVQIFKAPLIPIPKTRWSGLVHLHGMLPDPAAPSDEDLNQLVASSGDFGLAYLTERWAARFVSELFRHYTVCFVGYSIDDPVLRYMMDALAADRQLGEPDITAYAFAGFRGKGVAKAQEEWEAKGVCPILYRVTGSNHLLLHKTLQEWASTYRDGITGKESIVVKHAAAGPAGSTVQDNYVDRMLWALCESTGMVAHRFAMFDPLPPIEWLEALSDARFRHIDLPRFGVSPDKSDDKKIEFSFIRRPTPYNLAPRMSIIYLRDFYGLWDVVMEAICTWLLRHLDSPKLLIWVVNRGGQLHPNFAGALIQQLQKSPPSPHMTRLWRLVLSGRVRSRQAPFQIYAWLMRFKAEGPSLALSLQVRDLLSPQVVIREPFPRGIYGSATAAGRGLQDLVSWEIELGSDHVHHALKELKTHVGWISLLASMLADLTGLLQQVLDLMAMLEKASERHDFSYFARAAIADHSQNRDFPEWTALITILRDSWLKVASADRMRAAAEVERWRAIRFPLFRRMVFFALTSTDLYTPESARAMLLEDGRWWLWSVETQFEALELIKHLGRVQGPDGNRSLEAAILKGPPESMFDRATDAAVLARVVAAEIVLRLQALESNAQLTATTANRLTSLLEVRPDLASTDERNRFPFWMSSGFGSSRPIPTPVDRDELIAWVIDHSEASDSPFEENDWFSRCQGDVKRPLTVLLALSSRGFWAASTWWQRALQAWATEASARISWRHLHRALAQAPDSFISSICQAVAWWLLAVSKTVEPLDAAFFAMLARVIRIMHARAEEKRSPSADPDRVDDALNHPLGYLAQASFTVWYRQNLFDGAGLSGPMQEILELFTDTSLPAFAPARIFLASNIISLFRVDPQWTRMHVLRNFNWKRSAFEAATAWEGFLWSPRAYAPLLSELRSDFIETASNLDEIHKHSSQYAGFLTYISLELRELFSAKELAAATKLLTDDGLRRAQQVLIEALEAAGDQRREYWKNRIVPYLHDIWPKSLDRKTARISEGFALLCVGAGEAFPDALQTLESWLQSIKHPDMLLENFQRNDLGTRFPTQGLRFLSMIVSETTTYRAAPLTACLDQIQERASELKSDPLMIRLREVARRIDGRRY